MLDLYSLYFYLPIFSTNCYTSSFCCYLQLHVSDEGLGEGYFNLYCISWLKWQSEFIIHIHIIHIIIHIIHIIIHIIHIIIVVVIIVINILKIFIKKSFYLLTENNKSYALRIKKGEKKNP